MVSIESCIDPYFEEDINPGDHPIAKVMRTVNAVYAIKLHEHQGHLIRCTFPRYPEDVVKFKLKDSRYRYSFYIPVIDQLQLSPSELAQAPERLSIEQVNRTDQTERFLYILSQSRNGGLPCTSPQIEIYSGSDTVKMSIKEAKQAIGTLAKELEALCENYYC